MFSIRWVQVLIALFLTGLFIVLVNFGYFGFVKDTSLRLAQVPVAAAAATTLAVKRFFVSLFTIKQQLDERRQLFEIVNRLQAENAELQAARAENKRLRELLGIKSKAARTTVPAAIVSRDPTGISGSVNIDRGRAEGISVGDAVLDEFGNLLGVIREVSEHSAKFLLLTDGLVKIDVRLQDTQALGVVVGSHSVGLLLDLISQDVPLKKADPIVTSGLSGQLPAGILVGFVDEPRSGESQLFKKASVKPAAVIRDTRFVLVVTGF